MKFTPEQILEVLDQCCEDYTFPMLDNGYIYLAATRLSLHRSAMDWAVVIEVFGFSPRAGIPSVSIQTFGSRLRRPKTRPDYPDPVAYENYLRNNPHNDFHSIDPIGDGDWIGDDEALAADVPGVMLRGRQLRVPPAREYSRLGIELLEPPQVSVFEFCRYLAAVAREEVLATPQERRINVLPEMQELLVLDEWNHPNLIDEELASESETFQQLAEVLCTGDVGRYQPSLPPNTHWSNWPEGGSL
jgi:hypothetical protein